MAITIQSILILQKYLRGVMQRADHHADTFFVDKLLRGWKPNHFIQEKLKPTLKQTLR